MIKKYILILIAVFALLSANYASACSCVETTQSDAYINSNSIFIGKVTQIISNEEEHSNTVTFEILDIYKGFKGYTGTTIDLKTAIDGAACGYEFSLDNIYLVYTYLSSIGTDRVSLCSRTKLINYEEKELDADVKYIQSINGTCTGECQIIGQKYIDIIFDIVDKYKVKLLENSEPMHSSTMKNIFFVHEYNVKRLEDFIATQTEEKIIFRLLVLKYYLENLDIVEIDSVRL